MRVSIRRTLRIGDLSGTPVEDLGVVPDELHRMTRNDVLADNVDLLNRAGELLAALPVRKLDATATLSETGRLRLKLEVASLDRVDVFVDGRPRDSVDVTDGSATVSISGAADAKVVRLEGYEGGTLVAARNLEL
jgi:hypothetical protein